MRWQDYIEEVPTVMLGKPVGTRLTVEHVLRELGAGMGEAEILTGYPRLTAEHLRAAQSDAAAVLADEEVLYH